MGPLSLTLAAVVAAALLLADAEVPPRLWQTRCGWKFGGHLNFTLSDEAPVQGDVCKTCDPVLAAERRAAGAAAAAAAAAAGAQ